MPMTLQGTGIDIDIGRRRGIMGNKPHTAAATLLLLSVLLGGCSSDGSKKVTDLVQRGTVRVETVPSQAVLLAPPHVTLKAGITTITGEARLAPGATQAVGDHVQIDVIDANGRQVDRMRVGWAPELMNADAPSHYRLSSLWTPQPGTVLRLAVVNDDASKDDTAPGSSTAGGRPPPGAPKDTGLAIPHSSHAPSLPGHSHR